jgi:rhomboid protease GluP
MEEITPDAAEEALGFDRIALALCDRFRPFEEAQFAFDVPDPELLAALRNYLDLRADETWLLLLGGRKGATPAECCALTTRRIYWLGPPSWLGDRVIRDRSGPEAADEEPPPRSFSLAYVDLPEMPGSSRSLLSAIGIEARRVALGGNAALREALSGFLEEIGPLARGEKPLPDIAPEVRDRVRADWPRLVEATARARAIRAEIRSFEQAARRGSRPLVTWFLALACAVVFVAMVATGVSLTQPDGQALIAWGANHGLMVTFEHQYWRLLTCMFLHIGLLHLAMNLWCLLTTGPLVERFFGHLGYAALYLLSGLGGSIASLWVHPTHVSAGASGAIFGIIGGLLGFLAVRHREIPAAVLQPMRSGALAFVGYNVLFGMTSPSIDMAAHLGGLVAGFIAGIVLTVAAPSGRGLAGALRGLLAVGGLSAGLWWLAATGDGVARKRILADPQIGPIVRAEQEAAPAYNSFIKAARPLMQQLDRINQELDRLLRDLDRGGIPAAEINSRLGQLTDDAKNLGPRFATLPAQNDEIRALSERLASAQKHQAQALDSIRRALETNDPKFINGPEGLHSLLNAYEKDLNDFATLSQAYFEAHGLKAKSP